MTGQAELIKDLQRSELSRFRSLDELYSTSTSTRNPIGLRFSNIERAFNIVAASRFVGWPEAFDEGSFFESACAAIRDYLGGRYIGELPQAYRIELEDPLKAESWFDFTRASLYLSLIGKCEDTLHHLTGWVVDFCASKFT